MAAALGFIFPSMQEWFVILVLGLLLFGRRLPEVGRQVGRTMQQLRQGFYALKAEFEKDTGLDEIRDLRSEITGAGQQLRDNFQGIQSHSFEPTTERRMFDDLTHEELATPGPATQVESSGSAFDQTAAES